MIIFFNVFNNKFSKMDLSHGICGNSCNCKSAKGKLTVFAMVLCLFLSFVSCHRDPIVLEPIATLNLQVFWNDLGDGIKSKGAVDNFHATVYLVYENETFEFNCYFADRCNTGYYTNDPLLGEELYGISDSPFTIVIEAEIDGVKVRGESPEVVISDQEIVSVMIELKAGHLRVGTRSPRYEDIFGSYAFVGGEVYELGANQTLLECGIISIPRTAYDAMQSESMFTFQNDGLEGISGYQRINSEYEGGTHGWNEPNLYRYEIKLPNLSTETSYCYRAYALVDGTYYYGRVVRFTTTKQGPKIRTFTATNVTKTSVSLNAKAYSDDGSPIAERGFIVSNSPYYEMPQTYECGSGLGEFNVNISDLTPCTRVYYKSYVKNATGIHYGNKMSVCTYEEFTDSRDNNVYKYVQIGSQIWLAENMRYLPSVSNATEGGENSDQADESYMYVYGYQGSNAAEAKVNTLPQSVENVPAGTNMYKTFGVLYNAKAAQSACPSGWHLPTDSEWTKLEVFMQNNGFNASEILDNDESRMTNNYTAKAFADGSLWSNSTFDNTIGCGDNQNNSASFSATPGGYRAVEEGFYGLGKDAYWWTNTTAGSGENYGRSIGYTNDGMKRESYPKADGLGVRCIKD